MLCRHISIALFTLVPVNLNITLNISEWPDSKVSGGLGVSPVLCLSGSSL